MNEEEEAGFLSRWSRRKQAVVRGEPVPDPPAAPPAEAPAAPLTEAAPAECAIPAAEPEFDVASLPSVESLDAASDFTVFLQRGVPEALRSAALRKAWIADPLIRDHMSSLDYAWDFNTPGGLPNGFASTLAETGEALRKLISQAIGEIPPEENKPAEIATAEAPEATTDEASAPLPEPDLPLRLSEEPAPEASNPSPEAPPAPRRRHGGARPA